MRLTLFLILTSALVSGFTTLLVEKPSVYFTKGNGIKFTITSENGAVSYSEVSIRSVEEKNGTTSIYAHDNRKNDQGKSTLTYRMNFYSDANNWCVDAVNHLHAPVIYSSNCMLKLISDSLVYPYTMKVGDTLLPATASEEFCSHTRVVEFKGRKVAATESVGVGGEQVQAFRIECKLISTSIADYGTLGKIPTSTAADYIEWFVPSKGVVKSEIKSATGSIVARIN